MAQVRRAAERHGLDIDHHVRLCLARNVYCPSCKQHKPREEFPPSRYRFSFIRVCYDCRGTTPEPANWRGDNPFLAGKPFGPIVAAARKLGIPVSQYLTHMQNNERWCWQHRGWFDATELLARRSTSTLRLCPPCDAQRVQDYVRRKGRGNKPPTRPGL